MQFPGAAKPAVGIVFDSSFSRIDDMLALAMLHGFEGKDQARIAAVCVSSPDLRAAQFCDGLSHFYASATTGTAAMFMRFTPIGMADGKLAGESPVFGKLTKPSYTTSIKTIDDTADGATLIRNALTAQYDQNGAIVLSGPATDLAKLLDMYGCKDLIVHKVRLLCVLEAGIDPAAAASRRVFADWPTPIVTVGRAIGEALPFPASSIETDFSYSAAHPVADAYRAWRPMPYDAPSSAMAAMLYAVHPNDGYFKLSGTGKTRSLMLDPDQKDKIVHTYIEMASAKPVPRKSRRPADDKKDEKKDEKKEEETKKNHAE